MFLQNLPYDRLTTSIEDALRSDLLTKNDLRLIQAYQPGLSSAWLFQKAMSVGVGEEVYMHPPFFPLQSQQ